MDVNENEQVNEYITSLKSETDVYIDFQKTIEKAEHQGYLHWIHFTLKKILQKEMRSTFLGDLTRNR